MKRTKKEARENFEDAGIPPAELANAIQKLDGCKLSAKKKVFVQFDSILSDFLASTFLKFESFLKVSRDEQAKDETGKSS